MCSTTTWSSSSEQSSSDGETKSSSNNIPRICQFWRKLCASLPTVKVFDLDVSLTIASAVFLTMFRYLMEYILISVFDWPADNLDTKMAAASMTSIFHSLNLVPALAACFLSHPYNPSEAIQTSPVWYQETVSALLQFCTGYMIYDTVINIVWAHLTMVGSLTGEDWMFLGHHFATSFYMTSTRLTGAGHQSAMICMLLGESTNPVHNGYYVAERAIAACGNGPITDTTKSVIEFLFGVLYVTMRAVVSPPILVHCTAILWWKRNVRNPVWLVMLWTLMIWGVEVGSIPWIQDCWTMVVKYLPEHWQDAVLGQGKTEL